MQNKDKKIKKTQFIEKTTMNSKPNNLKFCFQTIGITLL